MDNSRMLQRNGRLTNLSAYNTIPRYNRSALQRNIAAQNDSCGCDAQTYNYRRSGRSDNCDCNDSQYGYRRDGDSCDCKKDNSCDECGYSYGRSGGNGCGCGRNNGLELAISSIGIQEWCDIYDLEEGFRAGTIFRQLDLPFCRMRGGH